MNADDAKFLAECDRLAGAEERPTHDDLLPLLRGLAPEPDGPRSQFDFDVFQALLILEEQRNSARTALPAAVALARRESQRADDLERSMAAHFQRDHLAGDGPEIDRWKRLIDELARYIRALRSDAPGVSAVKRLDAMLSPEAVAAVERGGK